MNTLDAYETIAELSSDDMAVTTLVRSTVSAETFWLTLFSEELCADSAFRAQFRHDVPTLMSVSHFHFVTVLEWGESDGRLFLVVEPPEGEPLSETGTREFEWDQVTDIAWQLASAVQHAHNVGLTHGDLTESSIFVSPQIRVQIGRFGIAQWSDAAKGLVKEEVVRREADTRALGKILRNLLNRHRGHGGPEFQQFDQLVSEIESHSDSLTARDIQRRLGQILLLDTDDEIQMIDHRAGQNRSGRSLVDELFEDSTDQPSVASPTRAPSAVPVWLEILCIFALATLLILGIWYGAR